MSETTEILARPAVAASVPARRRVLIVDADASAVQSLREALSDTVGCDVLWAETADAAMALLGDQSFDALICSCDLGRGGASDLLARLDDERLERRPYVIALGSDRTPSLDVANRADDFLVRPLDPGLLQSRLRVAERFGNLRRELVRKQATLVEANVELGKANQRMRGELQAAARVQQALLPSRDLRVAGLRMAWSLRPCEELAGDILNYVRVDEHHLAFYVLDVSGHGVSSALLSVQISRLMSPLMSESSLLKEPLKEPPWYRLVQPEQVVRQLNRLFPVSPEVSQYFTISYGLLHLKSGRLRVASAGHPPPVHVPWQGAPVAMPCPGNPVGFFDEPAVGTLDFVLETGARLWVYSDGMIEAADPDDRMLGFEGFAGLIEGCRSDEPGAAVEHVMDGVERWTRPGLPDDDRSVLLLERD